MRKPSLEVTLESPYPRIAGTDDELLDCCARRKKRTH